MKKGPSILSIVWLMSGIICLAFGNTSEASASSIRAGSPINIGAGVDTVLEAPFTNLEETEFEFRAFELNIGAPVDPYFHLIATLGYHEGEFDVEEAFASAILPLHLKLQLGREMLPFGYLNRLHEHDFPQVDQPFVLDGLITDQGLVGDGGHLEWMAPIINPTLTLNAGIYSRIGGSVGRRMDGTPYILRAQSFAQSLAANHSVLFGASYLGVAGDRDYAEGREEDRRARGKIQHILGFDLKYKWNPQGRTYRGLTLAGEYLFVDYERNPEHKIYDVDLGGDPDLHPGSDQGFYAYVHWDFDRFWGVGYRFDHSDVLFSSLEDDALVMAHSTYLEWRGTEFSRIRLQYQYEDESIDGGAEREMEHRLLLQATYFIGWHPPHRF